MGVNAFAGENDLSGTIPSEIGGMVALQVLFLSKFYFLSHFHGRNHNVLDS